MTPEIAEKLRNELEEVRVKLEHVLTTYQEYSGYEKWRNGPAGDAANFKVPVQDIYRAFKNVGVALTSLTVADRYLSRWQKGEMKPFLYGNEEGAEWFSVLCEMH